MKTIKKICKLVHLSVALLATPVFADNSSPISPVQPSSEVAIIPKPTELNLQPGTFALNPNVTVKTDSGSRPAALMLCGWMTQVLGQKIELGEAGAVSLKIDSTLSHLGNEGYRLQVTPQGIFLTAAQYGGIANAVQTLRQLLPVSAYSREPASALKTVPVPCLTLQDHPSFEWRGMMLDVSRYFLDKKYVLHYLDVMATHKINVLHLHLTDDCGWRVEIKKYPKLTEIGGFRGEGAARNGGFYSQADIREMVEYASARNITIVPELELPAHALASIAAYPHLSCSGKDQKVPDHHYISDVLYCPAKETTWTFLEDLMGEICELFPSKYIHIGGDEASYSKWKNCKNCQAKIKELGLKNEHALQGWMTCKVEEFLHKKGRRIIGWDEILRCGVSSTAGIMPWKDAKAARDGAMLGNPVVQALTAHCYFDAAESKLPDEWPGTGWIPPVSLSKAYNWDPMPKDLTPEQQKNILGAQGCLWTDQFLHKPWLKDKYGPENYCDYFTMPRIAALAEVTWTPKSLRDWNDFQQRMAIQYNRYAAAGWIYRLPLPQVNMVLEADGSAKITASCAAQGGTVRYTLDGSNPTANSPEVKGTLTVPSAKQFRAIAVSPDGKTVSLVYADDPKPNRFAAFGSPIGEWKSGKIGNGQPLPVEFDATGHINADGTYLITFAYTSGGHRLNIDKVELFRNRDFLTSDVHSGYTGGQSKDNTYTLNVNGYQTGAAFKLRAFIYGDIGDDSNGVVLLKKK